MQLHGDGVHAEAPAPAGRLAPAQVHVAQADDQVVAVGAVSLKPVPRGVDAGPDSAGEEQLQRSGPECLSFRVFGLQVVDDGAEGREQGRDGSCTHHDGVGAERRHEL